MQPAASGGVTHCPKGGAVASARGAWSRQIFWAVTRCCTLCSRMKDASEAVAVQRRRGGKNDRQRHQRTECHPGNGIDADAGELRPRPRRGLSRMHRTGETAGDADTPPAMSRLCQRHRAGLGHAAWRNLLALARLPLSETARELIATERMTFQPGIQRLDWQSLSLRGCCKIYQVQGTRTGG
jgi:hypothetical protein